MEKIGGLDADVGVGGVKLSTGETSNSTVLHI